MCVEELSLWRRAILSLTQWPLEVVSWFARLLSQSRSRGFDFSPGPRQLSQLLSTDVVCGACSHRSGWKFATLKYTNSTRSTFPQLRQHLRRATCAESLSQSNLRRATCTERLNKALAQSNLHRPTCTEHMRKALARSNWRRALAQSNLLRALAQSNLHRALACSSLQRATCAQQPGTLQLAQPTFVRNRAAQFVQSTLRRADSCRANLHRASCAEPLAKSSLRRANFYRAKLRRAILHRAKLRERALQKLAVV